MKTENKILCIEFLLLVSMFSLIFLLNFSFGIVVLFILASGVIVEKNQVFPLRPELARFGAVLVPISFLLWFLLVTYLLGHPLAQPYYYFSLLSLVFSVLTAWLVGVGLKRIIIQRMDVPITNSTMARPHNNIILFWWFLGFVFVILLTLLLVISFPTASFLPMFSLGLLVLLWQSLWTASPNVDA
ncbi:MAG: hypothetical protein GF411_06435 [Candidatus Lokiarchaeota archaeon]|nr:hypothetical protein [Candidatus Lokiarchaeota archaeon]